MKNHYSSRVALASAWAAALCCASPAWAFGLTELQSLLAQHRNAQARFTEQRFVSGLDQPLYSSGTLSFTAPDRFARVTLEPRPESMAVEGNTVTLKRGGRTRQMTLDAVPEATAMIEALRSTLNGDLAAMQKFYKVRVQGTEARWRLSLSPLGSRLNTLVPNIDIEGQGPELKTVEVLMVGGDRSVMTLQAMPTGAAPPVSTLGPAAASTASTASTAPAATPPPGAAAR